jgi:hypothetical protein
MFLIGVLVGALLAYFCRPKIGRPKIEWAKDKKDVIPADDRIPLNSGVYNGNTVRSKEWNKYCGHKSPVLKTDWKGGKCQVSQGTCPSDPTHNFPLEWNDEPDVNQRPQESRCSDRYAAYSGLDPITIVGNTCETDPKKCTGYFECWNAWANKTDDTENFCEEIEDGAGFITKSELHGCSVSKLHACYTIKSCMEAALAGGWSEDKAINRCV